MIPTVAIVGRPNTGKSTLFNRLLGTKSSITYDMPGTTRDRVFGHVQIDDMPIILVDTGGLVFGKDEDDIESNIREQSLVAIEEADIIVFVIDGTKELTTSDFDAAETLRKADKPVILVASKCDNISIEEGVFNLYELGFGDPVAVSAIHNLGVDVLEDKILKQLKGLGFTKKETDFFEGKITLSFVGKPNVGKSSLINSLLGEEQVIVSDIPGTTRDSVTLPFEYEGDGFALVDTAGFKRRGKLRQNWLEKFTVVRSLKSIDAADIAVLVIDASEGLTKQDMRVSQFILEANKGLIIVLNKADLIKPEDKNRLVSYMQHKMAYAGFAPVVFTSALTGTNILQIFDLAKRIFAERHRRIKTRGLNFFLERIVGKHPPKPGVKIKFIEQVDVDPPTFLISCNKPDKVHFSYRRYIENEIRKEFGFDGTVIVLKFVRS